MQQTPGALQIQFLWDSDARVWVATSDDIAGLATEADSLSNLMAKLQLLVPELLTLNGHKLSAHL